MAPRMLFARNDEDLDGEERARSVSMARAQAMGLRSLATRPVRRKTADAHARTGHSLRRPPGHFKHAPRTCMQSRCVTRRFDTLMNVYIACCMTRTLTPWLLFAPAETTTFAARRLRNARRAS